MPDQEIDLTSRGEPGTLVIVTRHGRIACRLGSPQVYVPLEKEPIRPELTATILTELHLDMHYAIQANDPIIIELTMIALALKCVRNYVEVMRLVPGRADDDQQNTYVNMGDNRHELRLHDVSADEVTMLVRLMRAIVQGRGE